MAEEELRPVITKSPDYKVLYATGVFGGVDPSEGRLIFYLDRQIPKMREGVPDEMTTGRTERELQVEIHVSAAEFKSIAQWMIGHVNRLEEIIGGPLVIEPEEFRRRYEARLRERQQR